MGVGIIRVFKFDGRAKLQRAEAMAAEGPFLELLRRIRAGDETAAPRCTPPTPSNSDASSASN